MQMAVVCPSRRVFERSQFSSATRASGATAGGAGDQLSRSAASRTCTHAQREGELDWQIRRERERERVARMRRHNTQTEMEKCGGIWGTMGKEK